MKSRVNKLVLGFAQWGTAIVPTEEMILLVKDAIAAGVTEIDCAPHYGNGAREATLGVSLLDIEDKPHVSTKIGRVIRTNKPSENANGFTHPSPFAQEYNYTYEGVLESYRQSKQRLMTDQITTLYLHDLDLSTHGEQFESRKKDFVQNGYAALQELKHMGKIQCIGIGSNDAKSCMEFVLKDKLKFDRIMLAGCYNLLNFAVLDDFFPMCINENIELYIAASYCGGLLSGQPGNDAYRYQKAPREILDRVEKISKICQEFQIPLAHAALQFVLMHPQVKKVVVGPRTREELALTLKYAENRIDPRFWLILKNEGLIPQNVPTDMPEAGLRMWKHLPQKEIKSIKETNAVMRARL